MIKLLANQPIKQKRNARSFNSTNNGRNAISRQAT